MGSCGYYIYMLSFALLVYRRYSGYVYISSPTTPSIVAYSDIIYIDTSAKIAYKKK